LEDLLFLIRNVGKQKLKPGILGHLNAIIVQQASLGYPLGNPQGNQAIVVSRFEDERYQSVNRRRILHPFQEGSLVSSPRHAFCVFLMPNTQRIEEAFCVLWRAHKLRIRSDF
jgi:hypothetical protein